MEIPLTRVLLLISALISTGAYCQTENESKPKTSQQQEIPRSISESIAGTLQYAEGSLLGLVEAMPEERFSFIPAGGNFEGVRSFGEQIKHVACAQFAFFNEFEGKKPPDDCEKGGHDAAKTKTELLKYLKDSFDCSERASSLVERCIVGVGCSQLPQLLQQVIPALQLLLLLGVDECIE